MNLLIFIAESHDMHPKGVPCRKWGVKCSNDQEKYGRKATCHPERNASGVEGSSDSVKMRCELNARRLGVPLPMGKVGLYRKAARAHLRHPRAALATALRQDSIEKGPCGSTSSPTLCRRAATPWSLSLTRKISGIRYLDSQKWRL